MKKEEIKKALECCRGGDFGCEECPYNMEFKCNDILCNDALTLITEQEKEVEYRKKQYDNQIAENTRLYIEYDKAFERLKAQQREIDRLKIQLEQANARIVNCSGSELDETNAVKDFSEKLKEKAYTNNYCQEVILKSDIDRLLKEYEK